MSKSTGVCDHSFGGGTVCINCGGNVFDLLKTAEIMLSQHELEFQDIADIAKGAATSCTAFLKRRLP